MGDLQEIVSKIKEGNAQHELRQFDRYMEALLHKYKEEKRQWDIVTGEIDGDIRFIAGGAWTPNPTKPIQAAYKLAGREYEAKQDYYYGDEDDDLDYVATHLASQAQRAICPVYMFVDGKHFSFVADVSVPSHRLRDEEARQTARLQATIIAETLTSKAKNTEWRKRNIAFLHQCEEPVMPSVENEQQFPGGFARYKMTGYV